MKNETRRIIHLANERATKYLNRKTKEGEEAYGVLRAFIDEITETMPTKTMNFTKYQWKRAMAKTKAKAFRNGVLRGLAKHKTSKAIKLLNKIK